MDVTNESLRDYIQYLDYETWTRKWLLNWARKHALQDCDAYKVWEDELAEFQLAFCTAMQTMHSLYPDGWKYPPRRPSEPFGDMLSRMIPRDRDSTIEEMHCGGKHCKDITFQVTEDCNMQCTYCYQHNKSPKTMTSDTAQRAVDFILGDTELGDDPYVNSKNSDGVVLNFIGGEPFLQIDLIKETVDYFLEKAFKTLHPWAVHFMVCFSSNGLLYFDKRVQDFLDEYGVRVSMSISIDGNKELHDACRIDMEGKGTYDRAMSAVRHYVDVRGGHIGSKMTIAPGNVRYVCNAIKSLVECGYKEINANCVYEEGWTIEHARILYKQLCELADYLAALPERPYVSIFDDKIGQKMSCDDNQNWCGGTGLMLGIDTEGFLYPCLRYMPSSLGENVEPYSIGDIRNGVTRKDRVGCLACITRRSQSTDECWNCPIASGCAWCSAYNYQVFGTPNKRATFICVMHRARVMANEYYQKLLGNDAKSNVPDEWREEILNG